VTLSPVISGIKRFMKHTLLHLMMSYISDMDIVLHFDYDLFCFYCITHGLLLSNALAKKGRNHSFHALCVVILIQNIIK